MILQIIKLVSWYWGTLLIKDKVSVKNSPWKPSRCGSSSQCVLLGLKICNKCSDKDRLFIQTIFVMRYVRAPSWGFRFKVSSSSAPADGLPPQTYLPPGLNNIS